MMQTAALRFDPRVEAAVLGHYGVDVLNPKVTSRRVKALVAAMPAGAWPMHLFPDLAEPEQQAEPASRIEAWERFASSMSGVSSHGG